jgi:shikimate dehydrogenase
MKKTGLVGRSILASRSPWLHEEEGRAQGIALAYTLFDFDALGHPDSWLAVQLGELADAGYLGVNVTFPFKQSALLLCDHLSEAARILGAVNALKFDSGCIYGENTDWIGFTWLIERDIGDIVGQSVAQIGAGGAGSATAYAMARLGVREIALHDPETSRSEALVQRLSPHFPACRFVIARDAAEAIRGRDGVVNATPVGMASVPGLPFDPALLAQGQWLADIIYFPLETALLRAARQSGHKVANGVSMVVGQAAEGFRLFTGLAPDRERMLSRLNQEIAAEI